MPDVSWGAKLDTLRGPEHGTRMEGAGRSSDVPGLVSSSVRPSIKPSARDEQTRMHCCIENLLAHIVKTDEPAGRKNVPKNMKK